VNYYFLSSASKLLLAPNFKAFDFTGYDPYENDYHEWLEKIENKLITLHVKYHKMEQIFRNETNLTDFEITNKLQEKDPRIHLILYFINPDMNIKKFDIYAMMRLQKLAHILPVIGRADTLKPEKIVELKLKLVETAHLNTLRFFDVYESL
jgi:septin family protein